MSGGGAAVAARARALIGTRFRPQGRDPAIGLDCVGTVALALAAPADRVDGKYPPRGHRLGAIDAALGALGCRPVEAPREGDVLVCRCARDQFHLLICIGNHFVHADAALRRVVERPMPPPWPVAGIWRLDPGES